MKHFNQKSFAAITLILAALAVSSCGKSNIFKDLSQDTRKDSTVPAAQLEYARSQADLGNYSEALAAAKKAITNSSSTATEVKDAYALEGAAILGNAGVKITSVATSLLASSSDSGKNLLNLLPDVPVETAAQAAVALNEAAVRGESTNGLSQDVQLTRAIANVSVVTSKVSDIYDIADNGTMTPRDGRTAAAAVTALLTADSNGKTVVDYATNANAAINSGIGLSSTQTTEVNKVKDIPAQFQALSTAINGGTAYVYTDSSHVTHTITSSSDNTAVQNASQYIIDLAKK